VRTPPTILVVDDNELNLDILKTRLAASGYDVTTATDGEAALAIATTEHPDLILLDIMMPRLDGTEVCRRLKADPSLPFMPIIMVTAKADVKDIVAGLDAGADEYLTKPVDQAALVARVKSMLRVKALHDTVQEQATRLAVQADELEAWNQTLERRVAEQLARLERADRLKLFLPSQLADLMIESGDESLLELHRRQIAVVFCDLRGFTAFSESAEPEEVMGVLHEYHEAMGSLIARHQGTVEHFAGDGLMVFFNDPLPCEHPAEQAARMSLAMRDRMAELSGDWRRRGYRLGFGVGVTLGYATLGAIGFERRFHYGAIGSVVNLASRLCDEARDGQILISQRVGAALDGLAEVEPLPDLELKGFARPVPAYALVGMPSASDANDSPVELHR